MLDFSKSISFFQFRHFLSCLHAQNLYKYHQKVLEKFKANSSNPFFQVVKMMQENMTNILDLEVNNVAFTRRIPNSDVNCCSKFV